MPPARSNAATSARSVMGATSHKHDQGQGGYSLASVAEILLLLLPLDSDDEEEEIALRPREARSRQICHLRREARRRHAEKRRSNDRGPEAALRPALARH